MSRGFAVTVFFLRKSRNQRETDSFIRNLSIVERLLVRLRGQILVNGVHAVNAKSHAPGRSLSAVGLLAKRQKWMALMKREGN